MSLPLPTWPRRLASPVGGGAVIHQTKGLGIVQGTENHRSYCQRGGIDCKRRWRSCRRGGSGCNGGQRGGGICGLYRGYRHQHCHHRLYPVRPFHHWLQGDRA